MTIMQLYNTTTMYIHVYCNHKSVSVYISMHVHVDMYMYQDHMTNMTTTTCTYFVAYTHTCTYIHTYQGPQISVDCSSLQFGLVPLGTSSPLTLTLTSHTNTSLVVEMRQAVREGGVHDGDGEREAVMVWLYVYAHV